MQKMSRDVEGAPGPLNYLLKISQKAKLGEHDGYGKEIKSPPRGPVKGAPLKSKE